jgi:hypothetical protein
MNSLASLKGILNLNINSILLLCFTIKFVFVSVVDTQSTVNGLSYQVGDTQQTLCDHNQEHYIHITHCNIATFEEARCIIDLGNAHNSK